MAWIYALLLAGAVAVLIAAEWPRLTARFGTSPRLPGRRSRRRKPHLHLVPSESEEFAERVAALIERDIAPDNAWRVQMDDEGWLTWSTDDCVVRRQPAKGFRQRAIEFLLNLLPIKNQA